MIPESMYIVIYCLRKGYSYGSATCPCIWVGIDSKSGNTDRKLNNHQWPNMITCDWGHVDHDDLTNKRFISSFPHWHVFGTSVILGLKENPSVFFLAKGQVLNKFCDFQNKDQYAWSHGPTSENRCQPQKNNCWDTSLSKLNLTKHAS